MIVQVLQNDVTQRYADLGQRSKKQINLYAQLEKDVIASQYALTLGTDNNSLLNQNIANLHNHLKELVQTWKVAQ